jgi:hypothetical protein
MALRTVILLTLGILLSSPGPAPAAEGAGPAVHPWASSMGDEIRYHTAAEREVLSAHPLVSYEDVEDIDAMAETVRKARPGQSFSRGWWKWDRLLTRYTDHGRKDRNALKILRAVFVGGILDRYRALEAKGEGDLLHIFFMTRKYRRITKGYPRYRGPAVMDDGRKIFRELHGGCGPHAGWGGAARMRVYEGLVEQDMLTQSEQDLFRKIVHQSFSERFIDFDHAPQAANNHAFGNVGGIAIALRLFPDVPQAKKARAWLDRVWGNLAEFGDWKEWTYYPYGPIFLHGFVDFVENGRIETDRDLVYAIAGRCLGFVHGGGVRGNPNSYATSTGSRERLQAVYANPWQVGYYGVETSPRDGHFWYRMAKIFKDPEFLWAAEQVNLGGRPPDGKVSKEYLKAYDERFKTFNDMGMTPRAPGARSVAGYLSPLKHRIPERLYLIPGGGRGHAFASFFIYDGTGSHLCRNGAGRLYEYCVDGVKYLGTAGKYTDRIAGQAGWDMLLVVEGDRSFPLNAQGKPDSELVRGGRILKDAVKAENHGADSFGQFILADCYGGGSRWTRQAVLTKEGYLVVRDAFEPDRKLDGFQVGPCWMLRAEGGTRDVVNEKTEAVTKRYVNDPPGHDPARNWFDAPAWDYAWWQKKPRRVTVYVHPAEGRTYGAVQQATSFDISREIRTNNSFAKASVRAGRAAHFLSVLVPHDAAEEARTVVQRIRTRLRDNGDAQVGIGPPSPRLRSASVASAKEVGTVRVTLADEHWSVSR